MRQFKFLLIFLILTFKSSESNDELLPELQNSICQNEPNGSRHPIESDCNKFILCDGGLSLTLFCRAAEPYFDRCNSKCVADTSVCQIKNCPGSPTTTASSSVTQSTSTSTTGSSTTKYSPPTVPTGSSTTSSTTTLAPIGCTPTCSPANYPTLNCDCQEQYQCLVNECRCDTTVKCPIICPDECGCIENCDCLPSGQCTCKNDGTQCPFNGSECTRICGCDANCDCNSDSTSCICLEECNCLSQWDCAFHPSECEENCGCPERCENTCIGNFCKCDGNMLCPGW